MKRLVVLLGIMVLLATGMAGEAQAQSRYGVIAGVNLSTTRIKDVNRALATKYHAGFTFKQTLPLGFSIQPSLIYSAKEAKAKDQDRRIDFTTGFVELPVSFQWGPDLLLFRPFLDVTPYVGYAVHNKWTVEGEVAKNNWNDLNRFEYGVGAGVGFDVWRFQFILRYNWNLGTFSSLKEGGVQSIFYNNNYSGLSLSLTFLFGK